MAEFNYFEINMFKGNFFLQKSLESRSFTHIGNNLSLNYTKLQSELNWGMGEWDSIQNDQITVLWWNNVHKWFIQLFTRKKNFWLAQNGTKPLFNKIYHAVPEYLFNLVAITLFGRIRYKISIIRWLSKKSWKVQKEMGSARVKKFCTVLV
jgi:hypothetical protein